MIEIKRNYTSNIIAFVCNIVLVYIMYAICRVEYLLENWNMFSDSFFQNSWADIITGCWMFDTSAILYTNILYIVFMLFPFHLKESKVWANICKWTFVILNSIFISMNIGDSVYFQYTGRRTTMSVFSEFSNESNMVSIFGAEFLRHWYLVLFACILFYGLHRLYVMPKGHIFFPNWKKLSHYYAIHLVAFLIFVPLMICGMRGGATTAVRPITISNANQYVNRPAEAAVILNTPFSMLRTLGKKTFVDPQYFTKEELDEIYTPLHFVSEKLKVKSGKSELLQDSSQINSLSTLNSQLSTLKGHNVVVLIVESFGREYIGKYNEKLEGGKYKGYAPFIDSLYDKSLSFDYTFCNGRKSIDGMPSILSSIPMFIEPFFLTQSSQNDVSGLAGELGKVGYHSAFFHGAENGSMGFQAFARATGFKEYYGRTEYDADKRFGGDKDFDGTWAIWDEPFLQFYATKMSEMKEPFVTAVFTASSHHPYAVPEQYKDIYKEEGNNVIHKCIRYVDHSLEKFFETASKQPWFKNTLFVFTSDHTNLSDHPEYMTDLGGFGAPILFYDPSGIIKPERRHCIAQQIDIMPTVLSYLGYDKPYVAFGKDLNSTSDKDTWAVNYNNGIYQYVKDGYMLQFDGTNVKALYDIEKDWLLTKNLIEGSNVQSNTKAKAEKLEKELKAIIQSYMERMIENRLINK